jgi:hypothetical protein
MDPKMPSATKDQEADNIQTRIETLLAKVESLPHVSASEGQEGEPRPDLFGNNFYLLFRSLKRGGPPPGPNSDHFLADAEAYGQPWQQFLQNNQELIAEINTVLSDWEIYNELKQLAIDLMKAKDFAGVEKLEKRIDPKLGADAIYIPIIKKLNPLLEKAAAALAEVGIDYKQLGI